MLTVGGFFWTSWRGMLPMYARVRKNYKSDTRDFIVSLGLRIWTLALSVEIFGLREEYDADSVMGVLALAHTNESKFGVANKPCWSSCSQMDMAVFYPRAFEDPGGPLSRILKFL